MSVADGAFGAGGCPSYLTIVTPSSSEVRANAPTQRGVSTRLLGVAPHERGASFQKANSMNAAGMNGLLQSYKRSSLGMSGDGIFSVKAASAPTPKDTFTTENNPLQHIPLTISTSTIDGHVKVSAPTRDAPDPLKPLLGVRPAIPVSTSQQLADQKAGKHGWFPRRVPCMQTSIPLDTYIRVTLLPAGVGALTEVVRDSGTKVEWKRPQRLQLPLESMPRPPEVVHSPQDSPKHGRPPRVVINDTASLSSSVGTPNGATGMFHVRRASSPSLQAIAESGQSAAPSAKTSPLLPASSQQRLTDSLMLEDAESMAMGSTYFGNQSDVQMHAILTNQQHIPPPPPTPPAAAIPPSSSFLHEDLSIAAVTGSLRSTDSGSRTHTPRQLLPTSNSHTERRDSTPTMLKGGLAGAGGVSNENSPSVVPAARTVSVEKLNLTTVGQQQQHDTGHSTATATTALPPSAPSSPSASSPLLSLTPMLLFELICCSPDRKSFAPDPLEDRLVATAMHPVLDAIDSPGRKHVVELEWTDAEKLDEHGTLTVEIEFQLSSSNKKAATGGAWTTSPPSFHPSLHTDHGTLPSGTFIVAILSASGFLDPFNPKTIGQLDWSLMRNIIVVVFLYLAVGVAFYSTNEGWSFLDAVYFCLVTATTTGYGDLYPTTDGSRVFTMFFILVGIGMIAIALGIAGGLMLERQEQELYRQLQQEREAHTQRDAGLQVNSPLLSHGARRVMVSFGLFFLILFGGSIGFWQLEEDLSYLDSIYLCVITMSTVGFGPGPRTKGGRAFCCPWIVLSAIIVTRVVGEVTDAYMGWQRHRRAEEVLKNSVNSVEDLAALDDDNSGQVSELEFLLHMLVKTNACKQHQIDTIRSQFRALDVDGSGFLDADDFKAAKADKMQKRQSGLSVIQTL